MLAELERDLLRLGENDSEPPEKTVLPETIVYILDLVELSLKDPKIPESLRRDLSAARADIRAQDGSRIAEPLRRLVNLTRNALLAAAGSFPAEWDLVMEENPKRIHPEDRFFFPGVAVYAEDIRSPFNMGSIFRTAEAFGAEQVYLSPHCVDASHQRAVRSAMGCTEYLPWERLPLDALPQDAELFALETGGIPLDEFAFPRKGIVIIGSEELGVSGEALERVGKRRVSIPMYGIKASLNVGVAFGILMERWTAYLRCSASKPR